MAQPLEKVGKQVGLSAVQSTAGAVPVLNEKGEVSMQKVKVHRYVCGKRPEYAPESSSEEESDEDFQTGCKNQNLLSPPALPVDICLEHEKHDPRLKRLQMREKLLEQEEGKERRRHIHAPEILDEEDEEIEEKPEIEAKPYTRPKFSDESETDEELDEDEIDRRRALLKQRTQEKEDEELLKIEEEGRLSEFEESEEESSEYEEYTESEEEAGPRLKPVFVRKKDRITIQEKEKEILKQKQLELEAKKLAEKRRKQTFKMVEEELKKETEAKIENKHLEGDINTDDENDEAEYEAWKVRELRRIKRDKDEKENFEKEQLEIERLRNQTEEERRLELRNNPKFISNKAIKGKYKFLQKYYHRGAFYLADEEDVFKRDFAAPTLEDHFDKTVLPKVMQVKNFGRSGRTKYTHLVDQDSTHFDSPWVAETAMNLKFHSSQAGGMKQIFERPSTKKRNK